MLPPAWAAGAGSFPLREPGRRRRPLPLLHGQRKPRGATHTAVSRTRRRHSAAGPRPSPSHLSQTDLRGGARGGRGGGRGPGTEDLGPLGISAPLLLAGVPPTEEVTENRCVQQETARGRREGPGGRLARACPGPVTRRDESHPARPLPAPFPCAGDPTRQEPGEPSAFAVTQTLAAHSLELLLEVVLAPPESALRCGVAVFICASSPVSEWRGGRTSW